jgi:uncharacterized membrane protein
MIFPLSLIFQDGLFAEWRDTLIEWLQLFVRWAHVFAGILWIGSTYFFTWLDGRLSEEEREAKAGERPQVWMVHSGGFYVVEKQKGAELLPRRLHWFRWEAALTWLSGLLMLVLVYYLGAISMGINRLFGGQANYGGGVLVDPEGPVGIGTAALIGVGVLIAGWIIYDLLAQSPLGRNPTVFAVVGFILLVGTSYGLTKVFSGRAVYLHVGAIMGTIMAANVWMRILPAQRQMIAAAKGGTAVDMRLAERAKMRSKHNTFMVVPVVFTMISNHYPVSTYGHQYNWLILAILILVGWGAAKLIRRA